MVNYYYDQKNTQLSANRYGCLFLAKLYETIELMETMPSPEGWQKDRWTMDKYNWFVDCIPILFQGAEHGEPPMMYLQAEFLRHFRENNWHWEVGIDDWMIERGMTEIEEPSSEQFAEMLMNLYEKAAWSGSAYPASVDSYHRSVELRLETQYSGSPQAALWCAYSYEKGIWPFAQDKEKSEQFLKRVKSPLQTLYLSDLDFLKAEFDRIKSDAQEADYWEDSIGDQHQWKKETYEEELPDPCWATMHLRLISMAGFMIALGLPYITCSEDFSYQYDCEDIDQYGNKIRETWADWKEWCRKKGKIYGQESKR